ncbi:MAG: cofactor-independent phosphoglycerate mutase [Candidatus Omnitrophica bacterium]|nr:cofactor-independent phosphoglycerate mutase [Candidatus Omnitrophota bacterium]
MKYLVMVADGMSDYPLEALDNRTPLESSKIPNMNFLAERGKVGIAYTIPKGMNPASDVANLSILGYDPSKYYSGRGPLEAANMGIELEDDDVAFRCNLITQDNGVLIDYSAGHITTKESTILMKEVGKKLGRKDIMFYPGVSYRHLMIVKGGRNFEINGKKVDLSKISYMPPHDAVGLKIKDNLPKGKGADILVDLMKRSKKILESIDVNRVRVDLKENPGNMIWLWGQGTRPTLPSFKEKYGLSGSIVSAVDLVNGIGRIIGLQVITVPGATGYYDTNYQGKADYAIESLKKRDFVFIHVEAPDEAGHNKDIRAKIAAIENFDRHIVGTALKHFKHKEEVRMMVLPDHATPISKGTHTTDPIPFVVYGAGIEPDSITVYSEKSAASSRLVINSGWQLMEKFTKEEQYLS